MNKKRDFLVEIGTEELPPKSLKKLSLAFASEIEQRLGKLDFHFNEIKTFATPRRLAVIITDLDEKPQPSTKDHVGPPISIAFDAEGKPTLAAIKFAKKVECDVENLERIGEGKNEKLFYQQKITGTSSAADLLPGIIEGALFNLPIPKVMYWGELNVQPSITTNDGIRYFDENVWYGYANAKNPGFVRPVKWLVLLFGNDVLNMELFKVESGPYTYGHRFHAPQAITLHQPQEYADVLYKQGKVSADFQQRQALIRDAANQAASGVGGIAHIEEDLLEEIAALNEWPVPITGNFDPRFLALPAEVLITTMQTNQKYFPVKNADGSLLPHFITFSNIESTHPDSIRQGNERVITPRLTDAEFFWNQDRKKTLAGRVESLGTIVFQEKLGTVLAKSQRVEKLADFIAGKLNANVDLAKRAALLAKTDLMTDMVGEFGNLQGIMGRYYALAENEPKEVAWALEEQYFPKQSGSPTAPSQIGQVLAIAEKIDTLTGIFSAGLIPTGDKDPYALRRAALGTLRTIIENQLSLNILELIDYALSLYNHAFNVQDTRTAVTDFVFERLKGYCLDRGYTADEFDAVISTNPSEPHDFMQRLQAVKTFRQLPEAESLAAANKRIRNILKKSDGTNYPAPLADKLVSNEELQLLQAATSAGNDIKPLLAKRDYQATLNRLAQLRNDVDAFFDNVMVMTDDLELRSNRLGLLNLLSEQFLTCADISKLQS